MADEPTSPPAPPPPPLPPDPIVAAATTAVSSLFETVFAALSTDIEKLLQNSGASNPLAPALQSFTGDMIKILNDRVKATLSGGGS